MVAWSAKLRERSGNMLQVMNMKPLFVSIGLSLSLCIACGGSDGDNHGSPGGSGGSTSSGSGGSGDPGGSSPGGSSPGGSGSGGAGPSAGGAPNAPAGGYSSGIAGDRQLGSLTDDEYAGMCQKLSDYFSDSSATGKNVEEFACRVSSALGALFFGADSDAALQAACKPLYDTCVASPTTTEESCTKPDATCQATVAEYDTCVNDELKALNQAVTAVPSCDKITIVSLTALFAASGSQTIASCDALEAKCPGIKTPVDDANP